MVLVSLLTLQKIDPYVNINNPLYCCTCEIITSAFSKNSMENVIPTMKKMMEDKKKALEKTFSSRRNQLDSIMKTKVKLEDGELYLLKKKSEEREGKVDSYVILPTFSAYCGEHLPQNYKSTGIGYEKGTSIY